MFCLGDQGCGNGLHKECFDQWARSTKPVCVPRGGPSRRYTDNDNNGSTCVFCRKEWNGKGKASANEPAPHYDEGYLNVGNMIGLANKRDSSSYCACISAPPATLCPQTDSQRRADSGPVRGGWRYREDYY